MSTGEIIVRGAGGLHFAILIASALVPRIFDWHGQLARLHPFLRRLFWVYGVFIVFTIVGFGTLTLLHARELLAGDPLGRSLAAFIALFWMLRLAVQFFVFDPREFLTHWFLRLGYHGLTLLFVLLASIYGALALGLPILK